MRTEAVRTEGLTKFYGKTPGVEGLDLKVHLGEVFGYLGPNGAGKTTTIRLLLDLIRPTSGRAQVLGFDSHRESIEIHRRIGYLPGELALYEGLTGMEFVEHFARLRELKERDYARQLAERLGLDLTRRIGTLSKGNKQKLGLVQAFMHKPDLLILDEPTSGLDPLVQQTFHELVVETTDRGASVLLSSHVLSEIEHLTHRVGIIREGKMVDVEDIEILKEKALGRIDVRFGSPVDIDDLKTIPGVVDVSDHHGLVSFAIKGSMDGLIKALSRYEVVAIKTHEVDLEEEFLRHYRGESGGS